MIDFGYKSKRYMIPTHLDKLILDMSIEIYSLKKTPWIKTSEQKPRFGELVLVYCAIYGRFLASYEQLDNTRWGNWSDGKTLGILPPVYWMKIPQIPELK